ncbi:MAG: ABC transporter permease [Acidimicrobiales bacterium]|nr:ABC transporter permease [Acidimicrobiales bacterium]
MTAIQEELEADAELVHEGGDSADPSGFADVWKRFKRNKLAVVGLVIIGLLVFCALFAPLIVKLESAIGGVSKLDPEVGTSPARLPPSAQHWFGTDKTGRDLFARVIYGARISLLVGFSSVILATTIGVVLGAAAGYYGRWIDSLVMRTTDVALALPYIVLAIALVVVFGRSLLTIILVLGALGWMSDARIFRSSIIQQKSLEYVEAARAIGCSDRRIIARHLVPNSIQPVIVYATLGIGTAILSEAALSFLGVGAVEPTPSWGLMINHGRAALRSDPHLLFFPAAFLAITIVAFTAVGDGLRDALDPKLKR